MFIHTILIAQTQYDYMDDDAVAGGVDRALNGIVIILVFVVVAVILIVVLGVLQKIYYWFNPSADPEYKRIKAKQEEEKKKENFIQEQRKKALPSAIDLGLSVQWASFNLGAYKPSDIGGKFHWTYHEVISQTKNGKINIPAIGDISGRPEYDIVTKRLGSNWRMPTAEECKELLERCSWETKVVDGVEGRLITGPNGNSVFLPFNYSYSSSKKYTSAHYWTSTPQYRGCHDSALDLRFGENCKKPAEIWCGTANSSLFCIRPVFSAITREKTESQKKTEIKNAYSKIQANDIRLSVDNSNNEYYKQQCIIRDDEVDNHGLIGLLASAYGSGYYEEKIMRDEYGVVYSLDGKRLLDGRHCNCKEYYIKEGTEFICNYAFSDRGIDIITNRGKKKILEKIILPSTLVYIPQSAIPDYCTMDSLSPNYIIIDELLIDKRKKSVVVCVNKHKLKSEIYEPIEEIEEEAFINCDVLQEVILPNTIKIIGEKAFYNCGMLSSINLPNSIVTIANDAFFNCKALHINSLPNNLFTLGDNAFSWCIIDGVNIPKSIKNIGKAPFSNETKNITSLSSRYIIIGSLLIDSEKKEIIQHIDSSISTLIIPDSIVKIREQAFSHTNIEEITIPSTIIELGNYLFWGCKKLKEVHILCEIETLPDHIFAYCSSLTTFIVPASVKVIGNDSFYHCTNLVELSLNQGLRIIENRAFEECINLTELIIPESIERIGDMNAYNNHCFMECKNLKEVIYEAIEAKMTGLPRYATNISIGDKVNTLPQNFLTYNSELEVLVIPKNVRQMEKGCIVNCKNLKEIIIESKEIAIADGWIKNCDNLLTIRIHVNMYEKLLPLIPQNKGINVIKIYDHHFLFFKW